MEPFVFGVIASELVALFVIGYISQGSKLEDYGSACVLFGALWLCMVLVTATMITDTGRTSAWPAVAMISAISHFMVSIVAYRHENRLQLAQEL